MTDDTNDTSDLNNRITSKHVDAACAVLKLIQDSAETPGDGCIVLLLAHTKLWGEYGTCDVPDMLFSYIRDFISLARLYEDRGERTLQ